MPTKEAASSAVERTAIRVGINQITVIEGRVEINNRIIIEATLESFEFVAVVASPIVVTSAHRGFISVENALRSVSVSTADNSQCGNA